MLPVAAQTSRKVSLNLEAQYNNTIADITKGNNPWGAGLGLQLFYNNHSPFKLALEGTADAYLVDDKVLRLYPDGSSIPSIGGFVSLLAGVSYNPVKPVYLSFLAGPSIVVGHTLFGIKPSLGFYFSPKQKWSGKLSYINIFNREPKSGKDFSSFSVGVGVRLF